MLPNNINHFKNIFLLKYILLSISERLFYIDDVKSNKCFELFKLKTILVVIYSKLIYSNKCVRSATFSKAPTTFVTSKLKFYRKIKLKTPVKRINSLLRYNGYILGNIRYLVI